MISKPDKDVTQEQEERKERQKIGKEGREEEREDRKKGSKEGNARQIFLMNTDVKFHNKILSNSIQENIRGSHIVTKLV